MKPFAVLFLVAVLGLAAWSGCQESKDRQAWQQDKARVLAETQAREVVAESLVTVALYHVGEAAHRDSLAQAKSFRAERTYRNALTLRDSLNALLTASPDTSIPLTMALGAFDSLRVGYDSLKSAFDLQGEALTQMDSAYWSQVKRGDLLQESVDSLTSLVGRVPGRKWWVPQMQVGYGAVVSGGVVRTGPSLSVGLRIPF